MKKIPYNRFGAALASPLSSLLAKHFKCLRGICAPSLSELLSVLSPAFFFARGADAFALILSLVISLSLAEGTAQANSVDADTAHVHARFNSPERTAAIERMHAEYERQMQTEHDLSSPVVEQDLRVKATSFTPKTGKASSVAANTAGRPDTFSPASSESASKPKSLMEVMLNGAAGFMGLPGLAGERHDLYDLNADQGLGFHQDGTARRVDGTTGNQAGNGNYDGRRAASYLNHGMGYGSSYGSSLGMAADGDPHSTLGYDPVTGQNYNSNSARSVGQGSAFGGAFMNDPQQYFMQRGLNYGMGWLNSMGEAGLSSLTDNGRARLNFIMDQYGRLNGEGDVLFPFYDGTHTTLFTQVGARTMSGFGDNSGDGRGADRWIGNFGLGQRWFPGAFTTETGKVDSGDWMFGYNVFFDNDFTRSHQRGGIGGEIQYDWLKLASNYYFPLSDWKGSYDFDSGLVEERPAQGWDVRLKGYLPFYRNVAITGAYSQWYGENVSMYSTSKLEKDPNVWSYGVEYTPIPLVSAFVNQRSTGRGNSDTEFGLRFTYHFDMPWEQQTSHAKVAETRTVNAARHDFVDRENRIILEYRSKDGRFLIEYLGLDGSRGHQFRIKNGFGKYVAAQNVRVKALDGPYLAETGNATPQHSLTYVTDGQGRFWVQLGPSAPAVTIVNVQTGNTSKNFNLVGGGGAVHPYIMVTSYTDGPNFTGSGQSTATVTVKVQNADGTPVTDGTVVTWLVTQAQNNSPAMYSGWGAKKTGLTWGDTADMVLHDNIPELTASVTSSTTNGLAVIHLTDIIGERSITISATATVDSAARTVSQVVSFGNGPLSVFNAPDNTPRTWAQAYQYCNGSAPSGMDDPANWTVTNNGQYHGGGRLPTDTEYQAVAAIDTRFTGGPNPNGNAKGAALAAGWRVFYYWTGEVFDQNYAINVTASAGIASSGYVDYNSGRVACRRYP